MFPLSSRYVFETMSVILKNFRLYTEQKPSMRKFKNIKPDYMGVKALRTAVHQCFRGVLDHYPDSLCFTNAQKRWLCAYPRAAI